MGSENEIDKIIKNSTKAELIEELSKALVTADKAVVVLVEDHQDGRYSSQVMILGLNNTYEAYGMLEVAKQDIMEERD